MTEMTALVGGPGNGKVVQTKHNVIEWAEEGGIRAWRRSRLYVMERYFMQFPIPGWLDREIPGDTPTSRPRRYWISRVYAQENRHDEIKASIEYLNKIGEALWRARKFGAPYEEIRQLRLERRKRFRATVALLRPDEEGTEDE